MIEFSIGRTIKALLKSPHQNLTSEGLKNGPGSSFHQNPCRWCFNSISELFVLYFFLFSFIRILAGTNTARSHSNPLMAVSILPAPPISRFKFLLLCCFVPSLAFSGGFRILIRESNYRIVMIYRV
jgi:hypothetical protein